MTVFTTPPQDFQPTIEASGCFIESDGELLYLKRAPSRPQPNTWNLPGGKLEPNETPRAAVIREISEETGLQIDTPDLQFLGRLYIRIPSCDYTFHIFRKPFSQRPLISLGLAEHTESLWTISPTALPLITGGLEVFHFYQQRKTGSQSHEIH